MEKILIVDDEPKARAFIGDLVKPLLPNASIVFADHPAIALELIESQNFSLIFTDIQMPDMNGLNMIECIHAIGKNPYIILVSAYADFDYAQRGLEIGASAYLLKPINEERMMEVLQKYMRQRDILHPDMVLLRKGATEISIRKNDIIAIAKEKDLRYEVTVYTKEKRYEYIRGTLAQIFALLPDSFFYIDRYNIVNFPAIKKIDPHENLIILQCGNDEIALLASRQGMKEVRERFKT
ncbi:MAG: response regulator [Bacteroidales bacterium]|jgi:DNA-binding LytR/AlgR family response regulator|nr:response regulator [Bacteroidales bacterium]